MSEIDMTAQAVQTLTNYQSINGHVNIHECTSDNGEFLEVAMTNESGSVITIEGLSISGTTRVQQSSGDLLAGQNKVSVQDGQTMRVNCVMTTTNEYLVLRASGNLSVRVEGMGLS